MKNFNTKKLRNSIKQYAKPSNKLAILIFFSDITIYALAIAGTIIFESLMLRILCGVLAGLRIGTLFLISHDAAHDSFTSNRWWNSIIGRIAFLPSFHNYSLWLIAHNRAHHQSPNIKGLNSWSPLSKEDYDSFSKSRKIIERLYRSPYGICFNYMIERWWKDKFFPYKRIVRQQNITYYLDFILVFTYMIAFTSTLIYIGMQASHTNPIEVLLLALILPFLVSNFLIGVTVYQHHTHETVPWFKTTEDSNAYGSNEDVTMHIKYPHWYNLISHNAMEHTAHHVDPRVPLYNLSKAQTVLCDLCGQDLITMDFSLRNFFSTMKKCKLYDYENHLWVDFEGNPTSSKTLIVEELVYEKAA
jgi:acyl-lipid omega-6 desaturase (Delta-12 desaturase)